MHKSLLSSTPSKSQPSLAAQHRRMPVPKSAPKQPVPSNASPSKLQSTTSVVTNSRSVTTRQPSAIASESRPGTRKTNSSRKSDVTPVKELSKKSVVSAKKTGEKTSKHGTKSSAVGSRDCMNSEGAEMLDVTTYLINRMLGRTQAPLPEVSSSKEKKQNKKQTDGDNLSEAGTYTIDDDEENDGKSEVRLARDRIGDVFGIPEINDRTDENLVRPVIYDEKIKKSTTHTETAEDDVFESNDVNDQLQNNYVSLFFSNSYCFSLVNCRAAYGILFYCVSGVKY